MNQNSDIPFYLIDILYSRVNGKLKIILVGRSLSTNQRIHLIVEDFKPYIYVAKTKESKEILYSTLKKDETLSNWVILETIEELEKYTYFRYIKQPVYKLHGLEPFKVPEITKNLTNRQFTCFEFDIPFVHRYLIDSGIYCGSMYTIQYEQSLKNSDQPIELPVQTSLLQQSFKKTHEISFLIAAIDIETANDETISFQELESKKEFMIIAISVCFGYYTESSDLRFSVKSFILSTDMNEERLLREFLDFLRILDPDCVITYNGDSFDLPYIEHRMQLYNIEFKIGWANQKIQQSKIDGKYRVSGKTFVDLFPKTWNIHTKSGKKRLLDIAEYFFSEEQEKILKLDIPELPGSLFNKGNTELLQQYVEQDVRITFELFHKLFSGEMALVKVNGAPYSDVLLSTQRVNGEFLLMRILYNNNILIPKKPKKNDITAHKQKRREHPHTGGQVITPKASTAENVIIADFVSMYPTLISGYNIGSETFISKSKFSSHPRSTLALLQDEVISQRLKVKGQLKKKQFNSNSEQNALQNQQKALKLVANSMYGATLYVSGRFFDIEVCNSITFMARSLMNNIFDIAKNFGADNGLNIEVIYSDTDSVFISVTTDQTIFKEDDQLLRWLKDQQERLLLHINKTVPHGMDLVLEDIAKRILFQKMSEKEGELRKKAYAYFSLITKRLVIKGFEAIRSDLSHITKKTQEELFYILLNDPHPELKGAKYLKKIIRSIEKEFESDLIDLVLFSGIIRRSPSKYKSITPAVGAFLNYCSENKLDPEVHFSEFPRFPYAITQGRKNQPLFKRARHPSIIKKYQLKIDRHFYIDEIIRIAERFELPNPRDNQTSLFDFI